MQSTIVARLDVELARSVKGIDTQGALSSSQGLPSACASCRPRLEVPMEQVLNEGEKTTELKRTERWSHLWG
jgi:hypothetical protein